MTVPAMPMAAGPALQRADVELDQPPRPARPENLRRRADGTLPINDDGAAQKRTLMIIQHNSALSDS